MRNTEKDKYWREMIRKQGELRHFGSMAIRKSSKGDLASAQEVDLLFRVALSGGMMTPGQLAADMGVSKTIISRLIDSLEKKALIIKERTLNDRRSYGSRVTDDGKEEIAMEEMNKTMARMAPIMSVSISMIAPLGLALYWFVSNILMII